MPSYIFKETTPDALTSFFTTHPQGSFAQSEAMGAVRSDLGRKVRYLAVYKENSIVAACQISIIPGRITSADITAGPLLDFENDTLLSFFTSSLRNYLAAYNCAYVTISPNIGYSDNVRHALQKLGWKYSGRINATAVGIRGGIRWMYVKDLKGLTADTYRDAYAKRHRRYIRNHDPRLSIRKLTRDELPLFIDIMNHTAERRHFASRKADYFYSLFDHFKDRVHFNIVELANDDGIKTSVAAIVFIESNGEVVSYLGGAHADYANYRGSHLLHDDMIRYAVEKGYPRYNFYGIEGRLDDPSAEGYGIYEFKSKFGSGEPFELIGEFVLPIKKVPYFLFSLQRRFRH